LQYVPNKSESVPLYAMDGAWGKRRYSSYSILTSALEGGEWSASRPGRALPRVKNPVAIVQEAEWATEKNPLSLLRIELPLAWQGSVDQIFSKV
jgi:hypothetical protein